MLTGARGSPELHSYQRLARGPPLAPCKTLARAASSEGLEEKAGGKLRFLRTHPPTFQCPRLAAPRMRPTQPRASRCGRPRSWARAAKGAGGAGESAKSPHGSRLRCARIPGRHDRIPSRGLGTPSHEALPRAGLGGLRRQRVTPPGLSQVQCGPPQSPGAVGHRTRPLAAPGLAGRGRLHSGMSCPQQHWAPPEVTLGRRAALGRKRGR